MSAREIAIATLGSGPLSALLTKFGELSPGRQILNRFSQGRGVFENFSEGWTVARQANAAGHEDPSEVSVHLQFSKELRPSDYPVLYWLSNICASELQVFDFGGNVGNLYYSYSRYLKGTQKLTWTVFDIEPVLKEGSRIASERSAEGLKFTGSWADACGCNVLIVSGAFHYWEDTIQAFLDKFTVLPEHIFVNRSPILERRPSFITVQKTKFCAFPCIVRNASEMIEAFRGNGYNLVDRWQVHELSLRMPLFPDRTVLHYSGFYFRR
jgi:putative methyltransferase (TIGR04325 family)